MKRLAALAALPLALLTATPAHADSTWGSLTCPDGKQAKVEAFVAGPVDVIVNGRHFPSWAPTGHYRMVLAASGATREHYAVLNDDGWPILVIPYCGSW